MIKISELTKTLFANDQLNILQSQPDGTEVLEWSGSCRYLPKEYLKFGVYRLRANHDALNVTI